MISHSHEAQAAMVTIKQQFMTLKTLINTHLFTIHRHQRPAFSRKPAGNEILEPASHDNLISIFRNLIERVYGGNDLLY